MGGNARLPSKIACDFRRQTPGPPKIHGIFGGQRRKNRRSLFFPGKARPRESIHEIRAAGREKKEIFDEINNTWICLFPFGELDKSVIAQKIACDFLSDLGFVFSLSRKERLKIFLSTHFMGR